MKKIIFIVSALLFSFNLWAQLPSSSHVAVRKNVVIQATPEKIWQAWTTNQGVQSFFAPRSNVELKIGGKYEIYLAPDAPQGQRGSEGCTVLSYLPEKMLSFSWIAPPKFDKIRKSGHKMWVVVQILPEGENKTRLKLTQLGWKNGAQWDMMFLYFDSLWDKILQSLKESLE